MQTRPTTVVSQPSMLSIVEPSARVLLQPGLLQGVLGLGDASPSIR